MPQGFQLNTQMKDVEKLYPFSRSTLHGKFHIGGCTKCGYEPEQTIEEVARKYDKNPQDLLDSLNQGLQDMAQSEISQEQFKKLLNSPEKPLILDVREEWEYNIAHVPNSQRLTDVNFENLVQQAKQNPNVVVVCHHGMRSMNATLYLREHGIPHAKSLAGGVDAYSLQIDPAVQRY